MVDISERDILGRLSVCEAEILNIRGRRLEQCRIDRHIDFDPCEVDNGLHAAWGLNRSLHEGKRHTVDITIIRVPCSIFPFRRECNCLEQHKTAGVVILIGVILIYIIGDFNDITVGAGGSIETLIAEIKDFRVRIKVIVFG